MVMDKSLILKEFNMARNPGYPELYRSHSYALVPHAV
ncbi:hypothetical protein SAMN05216198_0313 [Halopseudomonas litoralis]|uniref:Uncharacterized protein n=1 Tax=Halopseudomonas litoralis TaxID=797277 RepID=A0A1H1LMB4_9GAMM|nr:hypothetical protein SAMN05216198_0313 [Halopseudomonas litoralis]